MRTIPRITLFFFLLTAVLLGSCDGGTIPLKTESPLQVQPMLTDDNTSAVEEVEEAQATALLGEAYPEPGDEQPVQGQEPGQGQEPYPEPVEPKEPDSEPPVVPPAVPPPDDHEYAPKPGDISLERGNVYIDYTEILLLESYPVQINLLVTGNLPNPCHELRAIAYAADDQNRIDVEIYSVFESGLMCTQVLEPFDATIPLGAYALGTYSVWVNGEEVGTIELD